MMGGENSRVARSAQNADHVGAGGGDEHDSEGASVKSKGSHEGGMPMKLNKTVKHQTELK